MLMKGSCSDECSSYSSFTCKQIENADYNVIFFFPSRLAARFDRGYCSAATVTRQPCASRDADACVERAADPLNSGRIDAKPCSDPAHALCAPRLVQSLADSLD